MKTSIEKDMVFLISLCEKVERIQNFERYHINEGKVSILLEDVDKADMANLNQTMQNFQKRLITVKKEIEGLKANIVSNQTEANESITFLEEFLNSYDEALKSLVKSAANADFTTGFFASGWAKGMTIPGMVSVATTAASRLTEFIKGYNAFREKMKANVVSKLKDDQLEKSLAQLAQENVEGLPDVDVVVKFAKTSFSGAQPGWWEKAKSVIKGIFTPVSSATKAIQTKNSAAAQAAIAKFPSAMTKSEQVGEAVGNLFVNVKTSILKGLPAVAPPPDPKTLGEPLSDSSKSKDQGLEGLGSLAGGGAAAPAGGGSSAVEVDGVAYLKSKQGNWYEKGAKNIGASAAKIKKDQELVDKINAAAQAKAGGGEGLSDDEKKNAKETLAKIKDKLSPDAQAELKKLGIIESVSRKNRFLSEDLLTSKRAKNKFGSEDTNDSEFERWSKLAGIK